MTPDDARALLGRHYRGLGEILDCEVLPVAVVSSEIFRFVTASGVFCLKIPRYRKVASHAGTAAEHEGWSLIADVRCRLHADGVPVEEGIRSDGGLFLERDGDAYAWVTRFIPNQPFAGTGEQLALAGGVLARFHVAGRRLLDSETGLKERIRARLFRDMPLEESLAHVEDVEAALADPDLCRSRPHCRLLAGTLEKVRRMYEESVKPRIPDFRLDAGWAVREDLVHNDFHPGNILFRGDGAVMLDLEQMTVGARLKCLSFALGRFAFESVRIGAQKDVGCAARIFADGYAAEGPLSEGDRLSVPFWMRAYELEKILRILRKFLAEGAFPQNVERLVTHHIPLFAGADAYAPV